MRTFTQKRWGCSWCRRHYATERACAAHEEDCLRRPGAPQPGDAVVVEAPALRNEWADDECPPFSRIVADYDEPPDRLYCVVLRHSKRGKRPALLVWVAGRLDCYGETPPAPSSKPIRVFLHQVVERVGSVPVCPECGDPYGLAGCWTGPGFHPVEKLPEVRMPW